MTEDEAKQKWCPKVQISISGSQIADNRGNGGSDFNCLASDCMAWEWYVTPDPNTPRGLTPVLLNTDRGYCPLMKK